MTWTRLTRIAIIMGILMSVVTCAFAQNPTNLTWRRFETDHFVVYYAEGQEFTASASAQVAEAVYDGLTGMYGHLPNKVAIVVKDTEDFANGGAYFYDDKIEISATSLDFEFRSYSDWLWNVVTHELTHIFSLHRSMKAPRAIPMVYYQHIDYQDEKREDVLVGYPNVIASYPLPMFNVPTWLAEGVAQYQARSARFDRWDSHRDMIVRQAALNDAMLRLDQMASFNWTGLGNEMVYNHGFSLVTYIAETYGDDTLSALLDALSQRTTFTFGAACRRVLGISEDDLYRSWKAHLQERYTAEKDELGTLVEGVPFRRGGFINGFPAWSPDGSKLAYVTNYGQDYAITYCRVANLTTDGWEWDGHDGDVRRIDAALKKKVAALEDSAKIADVRVRSAGALDVSLAAGIQSGPVWLDEWNILFNRYMSADRHGSHWWDVYRYVINTEDPRKGTRTRITTALRGTYPDLSPDGRFLVFVKNEAGQNNLYLMDRNDNAITRLTGYTDGTRIYRPRWSPDGARIIFTLHRGPRVDIALIGRDGGDLTTVISSSGQDRDPAWLADGSGFVFSSDVTGIANLYRADITGGSVSRLTNVIGGAFSPAVSPADTTLAFSYYGAAGYEIRLLPLTEGSPVADDAIFHGPIIDATSQPAPDPAAIAEASTRYRMDTLDFSFMPLIRNDRGNMKFGTYVIKNEVIDQGSFVFSGAVSPANRDADLFAMFEYRRLLPTFFIEMYRQTRSVDRNENFMEEFGTVIRKRIYDLNELDLGLRYTWRDRHMFESRLIYSQYNAKIHYTHFQTGPIVHKPYYTYSRGFDMALTYRQDTYMRSRDEVVNPRGGRAILARYDRFVDFFLDDFEYAGFLREKYKRYPYNRWYLDWTERIPVPRTEKHTLLLRGMVNLIDTRVDPFYESQLGGPTQMRGYTFYSLSGRKNVMAQATYRFPLVRDLKTGFGAWYFNNIYGGVFADVGRAWTRRTDTWTLAGFKRDAGMELRLDAMSFYNFPTMVEFAAAYGPDDTWIRAFDESNSREYWKKDEQSPWKFYFTILFGFLQ